MCFQRSSERIEGKSRPPQSGWKLVLQSRTGCRETPVAKFVVCSWHEQLPDVFGMRPQRTPTSVRQKMTVIGKIRGNSTSEQLMHEPGDLERDSLTNWQPVQLLPGERRRFGLVHFRTLVTLRRVRVRVRVKVRVRLE